MRFLSVIASCLVEAWAEVRVQKARVVLSLVGVVAAVAAMTTVMALGDLTIQSNREWQEISEGRSATIHVQAYSAGDGSGGMYMGDMGMAGEMASSVSVDQAAETEGASDSVIRPELGQSLDPAGDAMNTVADRFDLAYWSRSLSDYAQIREMNEVLTSSSFHGNPVMPVDEPFGYSDQVSIQAVDPAYQVVYRIQMLAGRWVAESDANLLLTPVIINQMMWEMFGSPPLDQAPVVLTTSAGDRQFRVVGVSKSKTTWEAPTIYVDYDAWVLTRASQTQDSQAGGNASMYGPDMMGPDMMGYTPSPEMLVWVDPLQVEEARMMLPSALKAVLGEGWTTEAYGGENVDTGEDQLAVIRLAVMVIGGIVVLLGALGLLNVGIVTVKQRVREIGIRRAVGASRRRVFFSVFLESVVATLVAGIIGVGVAILIVRFLPLENLNITIQDTPAFPMSAALAGAGISTAVGALCGIIPAVAAVAVKPIDAIRY